MVEKDKFEKDLLALAQMSESEIDLTETREISNFDNATIGRFSGLDFRGYDVRSIANWCIRKADQDLVDVSNLWLNKIVSLIYQTAIQEFDALLTPARMEAWDYGPVFREIYLNYENRPDRFFYRFNVSKRTNEISIDPFSTSDIEVFEQVWSKYGHLTASQLTTLTHSPGTPWSVVWHSGGSSRPGMVIDVKTILGEALSP